MAEQPTNKPMTVYAWRRALTDDATPNCPKCGRSLGIRLDIWRDSMRDAWLCDKCGEFEAV